MAHCLKLILPGRRDDFQLRALYATWDFDDAINSIKAGADEQTGFYIEPSYKITDKFGVFAASVSMTTLPAALLIVQLSKLTSV